MEASGNYYLQHIKDLHRIKPFILEGVVPTERQLGHGAFGTVFEMRMQGGAICAGKKIHDALVDPQNLSVQSVIEKFVSECEVMSKMRHPNIVTFYGLTFLNDKSPPIIIMEMLDQSLENLLEKNQPEAISLSERFSILFDVTKGLVFLHSSNPPIVHRDLTARNILLSATKQARITDLGNSRIISPEKISQTLSQTPGTLLYMPPETLEPHPKYDASIDMFSFGHVSLYTLTHIFPDHLLSPTYPDTSKRSMLLARSEIERRAPYIQLLKSNDMIPLHLSDKVVACLENVPRNRPTAKQMAEVLEKLYTESDQKLRMEDFHEVEEAERALRDKSCHLLRRIQEGGTFLLEKKSLVRSGTFSRKKSALWKKYIFELQISEKPGVLKYYKKLGDTKHKSLKLEQITSVTPVISSENRYLFLIISDEKGEVYLRAETEEERDCWVQALRNASATLVDKKVKYQEEEEHYCNKEELDYSEYELMQSSGPAKVHCMPEPVEMKKDRAGPVYDLPQSHTAQLNLQKSTPGTREEQPVNAYCVSSVVETKKTDPPVAGPAYDHPLHQGMKGYSQFKRHDVPVATTLKTTKSVEKSKELVSSQTTSTSRTASVYAQASFTPEQLSLLHDLLSQQTNEGSHYGKTSREASPPPQQSQPFYVNIQAGIPLSQEPYYDEVPDKPGEMDGIYEEIDDDVIASAVVAPVKPRVPPKPAPRSALRKKPRGGQTKAVEFSLPTLKCAEQSTEDSKREAIRSLKTLTLSKSSARSAVSMLFQDDEMIDDENEQKVGRRPTWAKAKTTTKSIESLGSEEDHKLKALFIPRSHLTDMKHIAAGEFGAVNKAYLRNFTGELVQVAVKRLKECEDPKEQKNFEREMAISTDPKIKHPNIVIVYGIVKEENWIVMEYLPLGDLKTFLIKNHRPVRKLIKYMLDVAMGMQFISDKGLIHRDLAARNVLMGSPGETCKVSDFGLLRELPDDERYYVETSPAKCPVRWTAPESLADKKFSPASDVWSYGILVWEMFNPTGVPFEEYGNLQVVAKVAQKAITPKIPSNCPSSIEQLMKSCWKAEPSDRASFLLIAKALAELNFSAKPL